MLRHWLCTEKETVQEEMEEQLSPHIVGAIDESITGIEGGFTEFKNRTTGYRS